MSTDVSDQDEALMHFLYQSPIGLVQASLSGDIAMMNPMAAQLLLPLAGAGDAMNLFDILNVVAPQLRDMVQGFAGGRGVICDSLRIDPTRDGHAVHNPRVLAISLLKQGESALMLSVSDVTTETQRERQILASQLRKAARIDSLTGLPNRAAVLEGIEELKSARMAPGATDFAVLAIDCDRFGHFNDTYGRAVGDALLKLLAARLTRAVRPGDVIGSGAGEACTAAHLGGDEFLILLTALPRAEDATQVGTRLLEVLAEPYWIDGKQFHLTVSIGIVAPDQVALEHDGERLLQDADLAVDAAKREGRGRVGHFQTEMRARATHRGRLEDELRHAIADGQLFVVFQPLIDLKQRRVTGLEALVRWRHPDLGLVYPQEFIEIAEETHLICDLGSFVLEEACRKFMTWRAALGDGAPNKLSVNLSRAQLLEPDFIDKVAQILARTHFDPTHLMLEVTESLAVMDERVQKRLLQLKDLNIVLALDDFGVGYSSLSTLHTLPVDVIKIDKSFVSQIEQSPHHRVLIKATVQVAQSLGMRTIAEGIENEAQLKLLTEMHCDEGQGYLFSKPLAAADVIEWLEHALCSFDLCDTVAC